MIWAAMEAGIYCFMPEANASHAKVPNVGLNCWNRLLPSLVRFILSILAHSVYY